MNEEHEDTNTSDPRLLKYCDEGGEEEDMGDIASYMRILRKASGTK